MLALQKNVVLHFCQFATEKGITLNKNNGKELLHLLQDPTVEMIPYHLYAKFYKYVLQKSKDNLLGLHQGERFNISALGIVGQLIQSCDNVGEALHKSIGHFNQINTVSNFSIATNYELIKLVIEPDQEATESYPRVTEHFILSSLVFALKEIYYLTLKTHVPFAVHITFQVDNKKELERVFQAPVYQNQKTNAVLMNKTVLDEKIILANHDHMRLMEETLCKRIQNTTVKSSYTDLVVKTIYQLINPKLPDLSAVASNLNMSDRTLQRKLSQEGSSYKKIITQVKMNLAADYLGQNLSIKETSYLMGYSEPTAFVFAFKKWFNDTPANYQKRLSEQN